MSQCLTQKEPVRYTDKLVKKTTDTNYREYLQLTKKNLTLTREVKNGTVAFKGGQCGRMDQHVWQVVPGTKNTAREKVSTDTSYNTRRRKTGIFCCEPSIKQHDVQSFRQAEWTDTHMKTRRAADVLLVSWINGRRCRNCSHKQRITSSSVM